jgi:hypothetical protein
MESETLTPPALVLILGLAWLGLGFDLSDSIVPPDEIQDGGVPVDGVPALDGPEWISAGEGDDFLELEDLVIGLVLGEQVRAYPLRILHWHEVVNDAFGEDPVVVSYCPLTGSARAFRAEIKGKRFHFGVSGKLYKSNLLLYDRETKSLWSQILGQALTGPLKKDFLRPLPVTLATWKAWKDRYPSTQVLSLNTGYIRDYSRNPYDPYARTNRPLFPVGEIRGDLPAKAWIIGVEIEGVAKAYPLEVLKKNSPRLIEDQLQMKKIVVEMMEDSEEVQVRDSRKKILPNLRAYWFAWQAFYPDTEVYEYA